MKSFRDIRVIPVVLVAIFGLAVLKIAGLVIDGGYVFDYQVSQPAKRSWGAGQSGLSEQRQGRSRRHHRFRSRRKRKKEEAAEAGCARHRRAEARRRRGCFPTRNPQSVSPSEARHPGNGCRRGARNWSSAPREIEIRESLLKSAEKAHRGPRRGNEGHRSKRSRPLRAKKAEQDAARFKGIITMYEGMKPKDAAKGVRPAGNVRAVRHRLPDRAAQDVGHSGA